VGKTSDSRGRTLEILCRNARAGWWGPGCGAATDDIIFFVREKGSSSHLEDMILKHLGMLLGRFGWWGLFMDCEV
jgi:hypothetical protein